MKPIKLLLPTLLLLSTTALAGLGTDQYNAQQYKQSFTTLSTTPEKSSNFYLGVMSFLGKGTDRNILQAIEFWKKGWINKDEKSGISLALHLISSKDPKGINILTQVATDGSKNAQFELGKVFYNNKSPQYDLKKALHWFTQSSKQGKKEAQANLGLMYYYGEGTEKNLESSEFWYTKSAESGFENAQYALGILLSTSNKDKALFWLEKAADNGHIEAALTLADFYQQSKNDTETAIYWFSKAYNMGSIDAMLPLGILKYSSSNKTMIAEGFSLINQCNMSGNKQCLDVLIRIFMKKQFDKQQALIANFD